MKILKNTLIFILSVCLLITFVGCGETDEYDNFEPAGVYIVESIGGTQFETDISDKKIAEKLWKTFDNLYIDIDQRGRMGSSYIYMCFYSKDQSTLGIFTIYENGACCLGEDFENLYVVQDGAEAYLDFLKIYTDYVQK